VFGVNWTGGREMARKPAKPEFKQPITDRKMIIVRILLGAAAGYFAPPQVGQDGNRVWFLGREINDYTKEEFDEAIRPFEERIKSHD
jgi:hypothetical protein